MSALGVEPLQAPQGWTAWAFGVPSFPMTDALRREIAAAVEDLLRAALHRKPAGLGTVLMADQLHRNGATHLLGQFAQRWRPEIGLAIWPERDPPRASTAEDFMDFDFGTEPVETEHQAIRLGRDDDNALHAWNLFWGTGMTTLVITEGSVDEMLQAMRPRAVAGITEATYRSFPLYFTQITRGYLQTKEAATELDSWLPSITVYLRESEEDNAVLLLVRGELGTRMEMRLAAGR